ncbi:hypothetical protein A3F29_02550 [Candidatus Roizmanbacteria bacterium RIFCSPHIGHO2_12_FULL_33_9]|uniref:FAD-binding FR-type domain-containing protein n=1 Tax=Candidatus Roizmanbacteria bacterium RIFCSPHIGHO2_12_FULL_33_9 TaxID=1802045 RepID=A0A1F7HJ63_9BACT|nr:MAG: hypothetical protein A3F29_02550 [Candidatus Roizmanbacteria bacterium RIFCSPHIGHO2_12_FULL_33_9]
MLGNIKASFLSKKKLSPDVYEFSFLCKEPVYIDFLPGQYLIIIFEKEGKTIRKYYSISSSKKNKSKLEFIVKILDQGLGSKYLMGLNEGDDVLLQGPAGLFYLRQDNNLKIFVATGTGIAPIISMIKSHLGEVNCKIKLIWGLRSNTDIYYLDFLQDMAQKYDNFSFEIYLSGEEQVDNTMSNIFRGRVNIGIDKLLEDQNIDKSNLEFYISGDKNIVDSIREYLLTKGISAEDIKLEKFI